MGIEFTAKEQADITVGDRAWPPETVTSKYWNHQYVIHSNKLETYTATIRHGLLIYMTLLYVPLSAPSGLFKVYKVTQLHY